MKKISKLIVSVCSLFTLYGIMSIIVADVSFNLIISDYTFIVILILIIGFLSLIIFLNRSFLRAYLNNIKKTLILSSLCSLISTVCIFSGRIIVSLIICGIPALKEDISFLALASLFGFIYLFIIYFVLFILFKEIDRKKRRN